MNGEGEEVASSACLPSSGGADARARGRGGGRRCVVVVVAVASRVVRLVVGQRRRRRTRPGRRASRRPGRPAARAAPSSWATSDDRRAARPRAARARRRGPAGWAGRRRRSARRGRAARARRPARGRSGPAAAGRRRACETPSWARSARPTTSSASSIAARSARAQRRAAAGGGRAGRRRRPPTPMAGTPERRADALRDVADPVPARGSRRAGCRTAATAPRAQRAQPDQRPDQGRLAGAVGAHQGDDLAGCARSRSTPRRTGRPPMRDGAVASSTTGRRARSASSAAVRLPQGVEVRAHEAEGSPRPRSRRSAPRSGRARRSSSPRSSARVSASSGLASVSVKTVVMPVVA